MGVETNRTPWGFIWSAKVDRAVKDNPQKSTKIHQNRPFLVIFKCFPSVLIKMTYSNHNLSLFRRFWIDLGTFVPNTTPPVGFYLGGGSNRTPWGSKLPIKNLKNRPFPNRRPLGFYTA